MPYVFVSSIELGGLWVYTIVLGFPGILNHGTSEINDLK